MFLYLALLLTAERLYLTKMKIYFIFLVSINFVYSNANPLNINDVSNGHYSKGDIGSDLYRKFYSRKKMKLVANKNCVIG